MKEKLTKRQDAILKQLCQREHFKVAQDFTFTIKRFSEDIFHNKIGIKSRFVPLPPHVSCDFQGGERKECL